MQNDGISDELFDEHILILKALLSSKIEIALNQLIFEVMKDAQQHEAGQGIDFCKQDAVEFVLHSLNRRISR